MDQKAYSVVSLPDVIVIGRRTETGVLAVRFDCTAWLSYWPKLSLSLWVTPPGGTAAYPATTHMSGKELVWTVNNADTAVEGYGTLEIVGKATGQKKLSAIAKTQVLHTTTTTTTTPPEAAQGWVDQVLDVAANVEDVVVRAEAEVDKAKAEVAKAEAEVAKAKDYAEQAKDAALGTVTWDDVQNKPTTMPNPYPLTINGQEYDGSKEIEVTIEASGGTADTVPWTGITGKPSAYPPESHSHSEYATTVQLSELKNEKADKAGWTACKNVVTDADGKITTEDKPTALKNPYALTINGESYDGSKALEVNTSSGADPLTIYPVGSIYMSVNETSPASLFGGTWEQLKDKFLLGAGGSYTAESTGGEAEHALTSDELPENIGSFVALKWGEVSTGEEDSGAFSSKMLITNLPSSTNGSQFGSARFTLSGGGDPINNMPPYLAVNMWKRVA